MALFAKSCDNSVNTLSMFVRRLLIIQFSLNGYHLDNGYLVIFFRFQHVTQLERMFQNTDLPEIYPHIYASFIFLHIHLHCENTKVVLLDMKKTYSKM